MGIGENKLKRCVNISEGEVLEKDLDLGEIYDLLMIIGKINLKRKVSGFEDLNCVAALKKSGPLIGE